MQQIFATADTATADRAAAPGAAAAAQDAQALHRCSQTYKSFPWLTWQHKAPGGDRNVSQHIAADALTSALETITARANFRHEDHWISQNSFKFRSRKLLHLHAFNALYCDIDLQVDRPTPELVNRIAESFIYNCGEAGIPFPTYVIWSGRGLHPKWIFESPVNARALAKWDACQRVLCERVKAMGDGWPVDMQARDASRILRLAGSYNNKPCEDGSRISRPVYACWSRGKEHDFSVLAEHILPYSRDQITQFQASEKARKEARKEWAAWDENRRKAGGTLRSTLTAAAAAAGEAAQELHWHRLSVLREIAAARGGISEGARNEWTWIVANSLAWGVGETARLDAELPVLIKEIAPSYTASEICASASSVYKRLQAQGRDGLYKLTSKTIASKLGLSDDEAQKLASGGRAHKAHNPGALGLEKMQGLSLEAYLAERRRRQAMGARYSTETRKSSDKSAEQAQAQALKAAGKSAREIAAALNVSVRTAWLWTK